MQLAVVVAFLVPVSLAAAPWSLSGTCSTGNTCEIDTTHTSPKVACGEWVGKFSGPGINGRTYCTPVGSKCSYSWTC
ncbi:hypothetical protein CH063_07359 [Colletotrichum higginsianum]|uniref:Alcohol dehydrogenase n=2 Tax=Colletotrichum higginsianum TaxID=80884 RepID=H1V5W7_COLHI|nr:Alcohol dehydrogenase [Colletotrichum higginsianum IMI 349063]OBR04049.1 Alcohol dehydrogenase [Colletotrichum higginsianum IMI 349063]TIC90195.1 hypothetical protein CH35J_012039 [Colletotrichum higginsianum]GJD03591.1 alcohol dehydrogenase [Colletotrichum higginsianum]CCF35619.1 hypothetical protein CH063_07359 [Colletotrichum higginsianum]